jgi:hypothetical protein
LVEALSDDADHDVVSDETARVNNGLGHLAELSALTHGGTQHVASGNMRNHKVTRQTNALSALARALAAQHYDPRSRNHFNL